MHKLLRGLAVLVCSQIFPSAQAALHYVNINNTFASAPYTNWATAATNIQDAIDVAVAGDEVVVTNGVYKQGGRVADGMVSSNRVLVSKPLTLRSVNGPDVTFIEGYQVPGLIRWSEAIRCVFLANGAVLAGFTLTNGATYATASVMDDAGGGVLCQSDLLHAYVPPIVPAVVTNCIMVGNAARFGGGAMNGWLRNCKLIANTGDVGGGAYLSALQNCGVTGNFASGDGAGGGGGGGVNQCTLLNCTVTSNTASLFCGGAANSRLTNSIVYHNTGPTGSVNYAVGFFGNFDYSCSKPLSAGSGNIDADPQLTDRFHLSAISPCRGTGRPGFSAGQDIDGEAWASPPPMGCDEYRIANSTGPLTVALHATETNFNVRYAAAFEAQVVGARHAIRWEFGDGTVLSNQVAVTHAWAAPGVYTVVVRAYNDTFPAGVSASVTVQVVDRVYYVSANSANPLPPYGSWATAAQTIQDAADVALPGSQLLVTNGVYGSGGRVAGGNDSNRVVILNLLFVSSVNGPAATFIRGGNGVRGVYMPNGGMLSGFTITNANVAGSGGAAWCGSASTISNCVLTGNSTDAAGGAVAGGRLFNCVLTGNVAGTGGGASSSTLFNCAVVANRAVLAGGASDCALRNCTVTFNSGGGVSACRATNSILYYNADYNYSNMLSEHFQFTCTTPSPGGSGNIAAEPQLTSDFHLGAASPCRGAGTPVPSTVLDIDGEPFARPPAIGCDEYRENPLLGPLTVSIQSTQSLTSPFVVSLRGTVHGSARACRWEFDDGTVVSNQLEITRSWPSEGIHPVVLRAYNESNPGGVSAAITLYFFLTPTDRGIVHYVNVNNTVAVPPYTNWATAAKNIQDAIDVALPGDHVVVTNGVYQTGDRTSPTGGLPNRIVVAKPLLVRSVNGPQVTIIRGAPRPSPVRCVYLVNGAVLVGFTVTNGATAGTATGVIREDNSGGGVLCQAEPWLVANPAVVSNCVIAGNLAYVGGGIALGRSENCRLLRNLGEALGGGVYRGSVTRGTMSENMSAIGGGAFDSLLYNSALTSNQASSARFNPPFGGDGGGAYQCGIYNCTLTGNASSNSGGGVANSWLANSIVYYNSGALGTENYTASTFDHSCSFPVPSGAANIGSEPQFADRFHLSAMSPCRGAGTYDSVGGSDIDGELWLNPPAMGCDEYRLANSTGPLSVVLTAASTNINTGFLAEFEAQVTGDRTALRWEFGDGTVVSNLLFVTHRWSAPGDYTVSVRAYNESVPAGVSATVTVHVSDELHYVSASSPNPVAPYNSWATAARTIQDAVDAVTTQGARILVTNGIYDTGGRSVEGVGSNRVAVTKAVTLLSANGPEVTIVRGYQPPEAERANSIRCVYLAPGANLIGFTLTNGATRSQDNGGGVWCSVGENVVSNCVLSGNSAGSGGGAFRGNLRRCILTGNTADASGGGAFSSALNGCLLSMNYGGGAASSVLQQCTVIANRGGVVESHLTNCIVYYNTDALGTSNQNHSASILEHCCTMPLPPSGVGNIDSEPQLASVSHLAATSPCRGAGVALPMTGLDIDGEPFNDPPSMGCDEYYASALLGPLTVSIQATQTVVAPGFALNFRGLVSGPARASRWEFGDGTIVSNQFAVSHTWNSDGIYPVVLRAFNENHPDGVSATVTVHMVTHYVAVDSGTPLPPYTSWATAARSIQDAVDVAGQIGSSLVLVSNGVYETGGRPTGPSWYLLTNRVSITNRVVVRSVNGPNATIIRGAQAPGTTNGDLAARAVYMTGGAILSGFTVTGGATRISDLRFDNFDSYGGGVISLSPDVQITNCVIRGNVANLAGGGFFGVGRMENCIFVGNTAPTGGGSAKLATTEQAVLDRCIVAYNSAVNGGGVYGGGVNNSLVVSNWADNGGGGVYLCGLRNTTVTHNAAGGFGGGARAVTSSSSIIYDNTAPREPNYSLPIYPVQYSCLLPLTSATEPPDRHNFTNAPLFVNSDAGDFRLQIASPCIDAGLNATAQSDMDLDGSPRIYGVAVDVGAYEFRPPAAYHDWLQRYGLPTDGAADRIDSDMDHASNWQEWLAGTSPIDPGSLLRLFPPTLVEGGVSVMWQSVTGKVYAVERSTNAQTYQVLQRDVTGQPGTMTLIDPGPLPSSGVLYRVGAQ